MQGLILGIDLCDDYSQISCYNPTTRTPEPVTLAADEASCLIPTVICKKKGEDIWFIGEEGYRRALFNEGTMVDKLVKLALKEGSATMEGTKYLAEELLERYVGQLLELACDRYQTRDVACLVFTVQHLEARLLELLTRVAEHCGVSSGQVHMLSHTESFAYYVVNQPQDVWSKITCLYDLTNDGLHYYEMKMIRGKNPQVLEAAHERLEDSFSLDLLDNSTGQKMADTILKACAERLTDKKSISGMYLTGKGFVKTDWMPAFIKTIVKPQRKVFGAQHVFADGAAWVACDYTREKSAYPFTLLCEGRIRSHVSVAVNFDGRQEKLILAEAGTNWYEVRSRAELIPDNTSVLELLITAPGSNHSDRVQIDLSEFPERPNKTTRIDVVLHFTSEDRMTVRVIDRGFGELFPASDQMITREFYLS